MAKASGAATAPREVTADAPTTPSPPAPAEEVSAPTAHADAGAATAEDATPAPTPPGESFFACVSPLFAQDTFDAGAVPDLTSLCAETSPTKGADALRRAIVRAGLGRPVSEGMREWALLGWYELAAFAVVRAHCCSQPGPIAMPAAEGGCVPIDTALNELAAAANRGTAVEVDEALARYTGAVNCITRYGEAKLVSRYPKLAGGEDTSFKKMLARVVTASQN
jgi:hypothetical protein